MQNFGYMIGDEKTKQALIVDPAWDPTQMTNLLNEHGYKLAGFIVTHAHYDHVNAIEVMLYKFDVPVYANKNEVSYAKEGNSIVGDLGRTVKPVDDGETLTLGDTKLTFIHVPGHTPGSQLIQIDRHLITGDTLFIGGCGRSDLPGGNPAQLFESLRRIAKMPGDLEVCPGHDYGDAPKRLLKDEMMTNRYLTMRVESAFIDAVG